MKTWQSILIGVVLGVLLFSAILVASRQPAGQPVEIIPAPTSAPMVVQVAGEVKQPGVYQLEKGSRMQDAIQAAGGLTEFADQAATNLAARLKDGDKVVVPALMTPAPTPLPGTPDPPRNHPTQTPTVVYPIDINTATLAELDSLPGIGPAKADLIIKFREQHGGFKSPEDIMQVTGIGESTFQQIKDLITVTTQP